MPPVTSTVPRGPPGGRLAGRARGRVRAGARTAPEARTATGPRRAGRRGRRPAACPCAGVGLGGQVDQAAPAGGVLQRDDPAEAPDQRLCGARRRSAGGGDGPAGGAPQRRATPGSPSAWTSASVATSPAGSAARRPAGSRPGRSSDSTPARPCPASRLGHVPRRSAVPAGQDGQRDAACSRTAPRTVVIQGSAVGAAGTTTSQVPRDRGPVAQRLPADPVAPAVDGARSSCGGASRPARAGHRSAGCPVRRQRRPARSSASALLDGSQNAASAASRSTVVLDAGPIVGQ